METDPLPFLIADVARLSRTHFDRRARSFGITRPQWRTLFALARREGVTQAELAAYLEVEPMSLSRMLDRMSESGLVERRADPRDRRAWRLHLTPAAHDLTQRLRALGHEVEAEAFAGTCAGERAELARLLTTIRTNLAAAEADADPEDRAAG